MTQVIDTADVIVIGGGVAGLSTAMQLSARGAKVIVLERERLGNGSTGRAAGLLGQLRGTSEHTKMLMDGVKIVKCLEEEAEVEIFIQTGSLRIAETENRAREIRDLVDMGKSINFDIDYLSKEQVADMLPYMKTDDLLESCYCPTDGHLQPAELVSAYLKIGRRKGAIYNAGCPVRKILISGRKTRGVVTSEGEYHSPVVVNAAGPWSYFVAEMAEAALPTAAIGHYYLTTKPQKEIPIDRMSPAVRDRHWRIYTRPESGGLILGIYEEDPVIHDTAKLPIDFDMSTMKVARDDFHVAVLIDAAQKRFPWINERTPMSITTGIMTFTPDGKPFCGLLPSHEGLFHCTGFSGHGIVQSPVIGVIMAELILDGKTEYDIDSIEADRYFEVPGFQDRADIVAKCHEMSAGYYGRIEGKSAEVVE